MNKIAVLGTGPSVKLFDGSMFSIGVNDIWAYYKSDVVVCVDNRSAFNVQRMKIIDDCKPLAFYSQIINYDTRKDFIKLNLLNIYPDVLLNLDAGIYRSYCSPFIAAQVAYHYYHANEIHIFGVDLVNHPHLDQKICEKIKRHFRNLKFALNQKGCELIIHGNGILKDL